MSRKLVVHKLGLLFVVGFSVLLFVGIVEVSTYLIAPVIDAKSHRLARPAAYIDSPYYSAEFIEESFRQPGDWYSPPGAKYSLPKDFSGKYFHTRDGLRVTTGQPEGALGRILIFGASSVYSSEVPDAFTIPSILQRKLNAGGFERIAVYNYAVGFALSDQMVERLRSTEIKPGDIVIFFDGGLDVYQGVFLASPQGVIEENRSRPLAIKVLSRLAKYSYFAEYLMFNMNRNFFPPHLKDPAAVDRAAEAAATHLRDNVAGAARYTQQHGGKFLHALQPTIFTLARRGKSDDEILHMGAEIWRGVAVAFGAAYPKIRNAFAEVDFPAEDWSSAFDKIDTPIYLDWVHVTERGNEAIADRIFISLTRRGFL